MKGNTSDLLEWVLFMHKPMTGDITKGHEAVGYTSMFRGLVGNLASFWETLAMSIYQAHLLSGLIGFFCFCHLPFVWVFSRLFLSSTISRSALASYGVSGSFCACCVGSILHCHMQLGGETHCKGWFRAPTAFVMAGNRSLQVFTRWSQRGMSEMVCSCGHSKMTS